MSVHHYYMRCNWLWRCLLLSIISRLIVISSTFQHLCCSLPVWSHASVQSLEWKRGRCKLPACFTFALLALLSAVDVNKQAVISRQETDVSCCPDDFDWMQVNRLQGESWNPPFLQTASAEKQFVQIVETEPPTPRRSNVSCSSYLGMFADI